MDKPKLLVKRDKIMSSLCSKNIRNNWAEAAKLLASSKEYEILDADYLDKLVNNDCWEW